MSICPDCGATTLAAQDYAQLIRDMEDALTRLPHVRLRAEEILPGFAEFACRELKHHQARCVSALTRIDAELAGNDGPAPNLARNSKNSPNGGSSGSEARSSTWRRFLRNSAAS